MKTAMGSVKCWAWDCRNRLDDLLLVSCIEQLEKIAEALA